MSSISEEVGHIDFSIIYGISYQRRTDKSHGIAGGCDQPRSNHFLLLLSKQKGWSRLGK